MTLQTKRTLRQGRVVPKSQHQPERNNPDDDGSQGLSSGSGQPNQTCAPQPARRLHRAARATPAEQTGVQTQQRGSSAGPSSLLAPITGLSASEAAAGLPLIHRPRTRSEQRASLDLAGRPSADAEAAAALGSARARRCTRQNATEDGGAGPLTLAAGDITADASLRHSAPAAPKRRRSAAEARDSPSGSEMACDPGLNTFPGAKAQRVGTIQERSRSQDSPELTGMGDSIHRTQVQQATTAIDPKEPEPTSAQDGVALTGATAGLASPFAANPTEEAPMVDQLPVPVLQTEDSEEDVMLITSQEEPVDLLDSSQQEDATLEPVDLLDSSQEEAYTLGSVPEEPGTASHELFFSCAICLEEHSMEDCYIARMCGHRMCRDAAREVVLGAVRSCSFPVLCPICQAKSEPKCIPCSKREAALAAAQEAGQEDIPSGPTAWCCTLDADIPLLLTVEEEEQYLERSLKAAANSCAELVPCPQPNCKGMAVTGQEDESPALKCNVCEHEWCGKCNVDWHSNQTCDDYQLVLGQKVAEEGLEEYQKTYRIVKCPTCSHGIEKTLGCDHMTCSHCKTPFCWRCGQKRTALHDSKCAVPAAGAYAAGLGPPAPRGLAYGGPAYGGFPYGGLAHGGPALGTPAMPASFQPAQPGAPWPWLQPGMAAVLPGLLAPPARAHSTPAHPNPRAPPYAIAPPRAAARGTLAAPRTMPTSRPASSLKAADLNANLRATFDGRGQC